MFKFARALLLFQLLVSTLTAADQNSLADVKSDVEALQEDLIEDLGTKRGQEIERHPDFVNGADQNSLADVKSDVEALQEDLIDDLGTKRGQEIKRHPNYGNCPYGFTYLPAARSCYMVVFESHSWTSAVQKCHDLRCGSHLVAITSATENNALKTFLASEISKNVGNTACISRDYPDQGNLFWTSGQRLIENSCQSPFVWKVSSDSHQVIGFANWIQGQPDCDQNREFCFNILSKQNYRWNDFPCYMKICPVCEYKP